MKIGFAFFLLLNIVRCHNVSDFPFLRLKNYPKITKDKDNIHVDFELIVERNLSTRDFNAQRNSFFVFSLLYPLNLKLQHNSKLEYLGDFSKVRDSKVDDASYAALAEKVKGGGFIGKCSNYAFLDIIFNLESKLSKPIGVNDSTSLENEIKTIKSTDDLVINFYHFQDTLKLGLYTFSADFALRKDLSSTSISTYYDEFVLALGIKNHIKERAIKEMKCLTKTPITAAIMMKHFEKNSFQSAFCSYYFGYDLSEPKYELPLRNNLKIEAKFERKPSNGSQTLSLEFTADEKIKYETLYPTQFDIVIDLPKSFAGKKLDETKLCKPDCTPKLYYLTCKYEAEKGRVTYSTVKSYLENMKTLKIIMDLSGTDESLYLTHKSSEVSAHFYLKPYVASIDLENVDFNDEISSNTKYKFVADECSGVVKELFGDFYKLAHSRRYLLYGGTAKVEMNVPQTLMYAITKVDNFNVMKVYLSANAKLAGQKATLKLTAGRPDQEFFGLPTEADYDKNKLLPRNKGVTRSLNRLSVEFEYNLRLTDDDNDKFHKITIVFRSKDKHLLNLYDPDYLRFSLVGKSGNLPLNVFPKVPVALSDVYSPKSSEVKVTGPYLVRKSGLIVMQFKIKAAINNRLVVHFELDSKVKKLVGKYVSGELLNTFDGIFEVKTDGLKYVEFFFDPSYKTGTEYTFSVNLSFDTTGVNKFPYEKMTLYVDPEPLLRGGMFTPNPLSESVFTQEYSFSRINDLGASLVPCLAADTKFSSSMFRSGDNATYIFTRMFDCQKPWLGPKTSDHGDISVTVVDEEKKDGYRVTVTEPLR
ncbi:hypothetical protein TpMuguga_04g00328 [Theileria parva strain Muguga]|uniref:Uncharacterized protein n=1 Tax=Theileria parva TaxID=5875 RepID=Q4N2M0_THEPA|nr:uncharacterized protein TpMuguga_04g00328 [Theileria parva strain Muguga]EAN31680.1 hypothetical protein TpMuguga_04g00328 [Theileria parva strain Muguga]|eukprot:XP_763963.1 hypothetical protein [Theileria parva strain Muguga]